MKKIMFMMVLGLITLGSNAQMKIAHINTGELLEQMPEVKALEEKIVKVREQWEQVLSQKQEEFRVKVAAYQKMIEDPNASKGLIEVKQAELEQLQSSYQDLERKANEDMQKQQQEFLTPILEKVKKAIEEVAKANGFSYVLESTEGSGLLYGDPSFDLLAKVRAKLGIQ
jgi:outer membrane protein